MSKRLLPLMVTLLLFWPIACTQVHDNYENQLAEQKAHEGQEHHNHDNNNEYDGDLPDHDLESDSLTDHTEHLEDFTIELSPESSNLAGLSISTVTYGQIAATLELPGEIGFNEDKLVHIAPRFAGIAQQANYRVGDHVEAGRVMATVESNESMNSYTITAPISGWVIERHIIPGEFVSEENSIYVIADLSSVWVNLAVYPKDFDRIKKRQVAQIKTLGASDSTTGIIDYITPIIDFRTRNATARITLPNPDNTWRPGTFVQASITTQVGHESLVIESDAVQFLGEKRVVFVVDGPNRFRPVEISIGESDAKYIQIIDGLKEGAEYVSSGAFELKAKIVTGNLDAHAGHGH